MSLIPSAFAMLLSISIFSANFVGATQIENTLKDYVDKQASVSQELSREEMYNLDLDVPEPFTEDDLRMLTTMVFNENGLVTNEVLVVNEEHPEGIYMSSDIMHEWTAQVCLNHLKDDRFPDNIYDNLDYPRYASEYRSKELADKCKTQYPKEWARVEQTCLLAMHGYVDLPSNVIYESNYPQLGTRFAAVYVDTGWFRSWSYFAYG